MENQNSKSANLILESSLQSFFFSKLQEINQKTTRPASNQEIFYLSIVLDQFGESNKFFDEQEGRPIEKMLGMKLLETSQQSESQRKRSLREIGDTALFVCGYFYESLNSKLIDVGYYENLGQIAYRRLNNIIPQAYEVPKFFECMSDRFNTLSNLISIISKDVFANDMNEEAYLIITDDKKIKAS
jgi:hypothetical protein